MTAAQALGPGMAAAPKGGRDARSAADGSASRTDSGFRDVMDSASRSSSSEAHSSDKTRASGDRSLASSSASSGDETGDVAPQDGDSPDPASAPSEQTGVTTLSLVLAALAGSTITAPNGAAADQGSGEGLSRELAGLTTSAFGANLSGAPGEVVLDAGPWLPGAEEGGETIDAAQLLELLTGGAAQSDGTELAKDAEGGVAVATLKATVTGQEKHLALTQPLPEVVPEPDAAVAADATVSLTADAEAAPVLQQAAKAVTAPVDRSEQNRARTAAPGAGEAVVDSDRRGLPPVAGQNSEGGPAFADQNIAHQDGRSQDGKSSSNTSSGQQTSQTFLAALNGAGPHAASQVREAAADSGVYEPLSAQIAAEVRAELRADGLGETSSDGVVKVLQLELKPANLGTVTVRMSLKDNVINLHMTAQRHDTLAAIEREREALAGALASAGYAVDGITTAHNSDASRGATALSGAGDSASFTSAGQSQGQPSQGQGLANSSGGREGSGQGQWDGDGFSGRPEGKDDGGNLARRATDALYV